MGARRRPPDTAAGEYVLHDFRTFDWDAWAAAPPDEREELTAEAVSFLEAEADTEEGALACFSVLGHKADLLLVALRPTMRELDTLQRQFQQLGLARLTDRATSAIGVTEASGYTESAAAYFDPEREPDPGLERYIESRLHPDLPDAEFVSFYFMNKRRDPDANWYDLPYEERADHVSRHGEIGKGYAGRVTQLITGTVGFDDWEWGVTLFANDMVAIKELLTEMRFDPSTSRFAEFGRFYVGRRFPPADLPAVLAGDPIPTDASAASASDEDVSAPIDALDVDLSLPADAHAVILESEAPGEAVQGELDDLREHFEHYDSHVSTTVTTRGDGSAVVSVWTTERATDTAAGFLEELPGITRTRRGPIGTEGETTTASTGDDAAGEVRSALEAAGVYAGSPHGEDVHALVVYSSAGTETLATELDPLVDRFDALDDHRGTQVYAGRETARRAIVSLWETAEAAETAAEELQGLPDIERETDDDAGFTTMGMFYRVKPAHRADFVETFRDVSGVLADMDGHRETDLLVNVDDEHDMFIASRWRAKEDAMAFFRSDAFRETVQFGRDVLAERPRHVFLV